MPMKSEDALKLMGLNSLPPNKEDATLLLRCIEVSVQNYGSDWVRKHRDRLLREFEAFTGIRLDYQPK